MKSNIDISDLIAKHITDTLTDEERTLLDKWLEDPYNQLEFDVLTSKETIQKNRSDFEQFNPEEDWKKLDREISRKKRVLHWMKYAAAIVLPVGIAIWAFMYSDFALRNQDIVAQNNFAIESEDVELRMHDGKVYAIDKDTSISRSDVHIQVDSSSISYQYKQEVEKLAYNTIRIPRGKQYQLNLSDGTKVWLNADTKFRYPVSFVGDKREVFVESGEVYFEVAKDTKKPFLVHFNNHKVKVLGTQFNVKSYEENGADLVTLAEGSIQIDNDNTSVELVPNQQAIIDRESNHMKVSAVNAKFFTAWKNKRFLYKQEKLEDIMNDLSRFYNIKIFYRNEKIKEEMFSLRLSQEDSFETILENFELTGKVEFEINKNNIIIQ